MEREPGTIEHGVAIALPAREARLNLWPCRAVIQKTWTPTKAAPQELTFVLHEMDGIFSGNNRWRFTASVVNP